jgi:hypothetical protein
MKRKRKMTLNQKGQECQKQKKISLIKVTNIKHMILMTKPRSGTKQSSLEGTDMLI